MVIVEIIDMAVHVENRERRKIFSECNLFAIGQHQARPEFDTVIWVLSWNNHMQYVHLCSCKYLRYVERSILESKSWLLQQYLKNLHLQPTSTLDMHQLLSQ